MSDHVSELKVNSIIVLKTYYTMPRQANYIHQLSKWKVDSKENCAYFHKKEEAFDLLRIPVHSFRTDLAITVKAAGNEENKY